MKKTTKQGFTIIEVVLVLAIAALIFLMAFVAFPALQRSQRDTARKNAVSTVVSASNDLLSNNRGNINQLTTTNIENYVAELKEAGYDVTVETAPNTETTASGASDTIQIYPEAVCSATAGKVKPGSSRQFAVITLLESQARFCQNG